MAKNRFFPISCRSCNWPVKVWNFWTNERTFGNNKNLCMPEKTKCMDIKSLNNFIKRSAQPWDLLIINHLWLIDEMLYLRQVNELFEIHSKFMAKLAMNFIKPVVLSLSKHSVVPQLNTFLNILTLL